MSKYGLEFLANKHPYIFIKLDKKFLKTLINEAVNNKENPITSKSFAIKLDCKYNHKWGICTAVRNWYSGSTSMPLWALDKILHLTKYSWKDAEKHLIWLKAGQQKGEISPKLPFETNREFGSIVGHILGDGSINYKYKQVFFSNTDPDLLLEFAKCMESIFGIKPRIWIQKISKYEEKREWLKRVNSLNQIPRNHPVGLFYPRICGLVLHAIFGEFASGKAKSVTSEIRRTKDEFKSALVRAFFDDEATVYVSSHTIRVFQDDITILNAVQEILFGFGITNNQIHYYIKRGKRRHYFNISGYGNFVKFYNKISFTSKRKLLALRKLISSNKKHFKPYKN